MFSKNLEIFIKVMAVSVLAIMVLSQIPVESRVLLSLEQEKSTINKLDKLVFIPRATSGGSSGPEPQGYPGTHGPTCQKREGLPPLTALVPGTGITVRSNSQHWQGKSSESVTAEKFPDFWFYVPYSANSNLSAEFVLLDNDTDEEKYRHQYQLTGVPGIIHIRSPHELKANKPYYWSLTVLCDSKSGDSNPYVYGKIKRVEVTPAYIPSQILTPEQKAILYAKDGLWNETLSTLINEIHPINPLLAKQRLTELLSSEYVNLRELSEVPISPCCK